MRPTLLFSIHMWFIRLVTKQVELVQNQLKINEILKTIEKSINDASMHRICIDKNGKKKRRKR